jgi:ribosomal 50S subunit-recycling heat shock protein
MKKLLALLVVGGLLALTTGCPPGSTTEPKKEEKKDKDKTPGGDTTTQPPKPVSGEVKKSEGGKITVGDTEYAIPDAAKVTIDGKDKKAADIKAGDTATITFDKDKKVTAVDVKPAATVIPPVDTTPKPVSGAVTKSEGGKITVGDMEYAIPDAAKVTIDGKDKKAADIKAGDTATITFDKDKKVTAVDVKPAAATPPPDMTPKPVSGKLTKIEGSKITVADKALDVPDTAKITVDGADKKIADLKDIKVDDKTMATVTLDKDGKVTALEVKTK